MVIRVARPCDRSEGGGGVVEVMRQHRDEDVSNSQHSLCMQVEAVSCADAVHAASADRRRRRLCDCAARSTRDMPDRTSRRRRGRGRRDAGSSSQQGRRRRVATSFGAATCKTLSRRSTVVVLVDGYYGKRDTYLLPFSRSSSRVDSPLTW